MAVTVSKYVRTEVEESTFTTPVDGLIVIPDSPGLMLKLNAPVPFAAVNAKELSACPVVVRTSDPLETTIPR